jgi:hemoglobin
LYRFILLFASLSSPPYSDETGLKSDPEFRSAFVGYIEWGTRLAVINSQLTRNNMNDAGPMPEWGWGEVKGPYKVVGSFFQNEKK